MRNIYIAIALSLLLPTFALAQKEGDYRRSSIYSICISHDKAKYTSEISDVFVSMPTPDKYNNHDLNIKLISSMDKKESEVDITKFLEANNVARRVVALWFIPNHTYCEIDNVQGQQSGVYH